MTALTAIIQAVLLFSSGSTGPPSYRDVLQSQPKSQSAELAEAGKITALMLELYQEGKYEEALPLAKRAVQIRESVLSADDPLLRNALVNLVEIYFALEKFGDAESPLERLVKSYNKTDPVAPQFARVLGRMALVHYIKGNLIKSEAAYQRALEVTEKAFGPDSILAAQAAFSLAEFYQVRRNYKKGEPLYQRVVAIREKESGPAQREQLAIAVDRYSCLLRKAKRVDEAKELEERTFGPPPQTPPGNQDDGGTLGNVLNGKAISMPRPSYPEEARAGRVSGTVVVRVVIDETGKVLRACAITGPPPLIRESELAAYRARFSPTKLSGQPVKVSGYINYNFVVR